MSRRARPPRAFTLTELLVVIGVIAILAGLAAPAISGARKRAGIASGASHLRDLVMMFDAKAQSIQSTWPTRFVPDDPIADLSLGHTTMYSDRVLTQTVVWAPAVESQKLADLSPEMYSALVTPKLQRELAEVAWPNDFWMNNPQIGAGMSYLYSPALFTRWELWDPTQTANRANPDAFRMRVPQSAVRYPSLKVALFERADHYDTRSRIGFESEYAPGSAWHVGACDGSVRRVRRGGLEPSVHVDWVIDSDADLPSPLPCGTTERGYLGRDIG